MQKLFFTQNRYMATNLKKEVMNLISRFDAAQEAFTANSAELKKITKQHKKELKAAKAETRAAQIEVEALKAELAILRAGGPEKKEVREATSPKPAAKKKAGRPKKTVAPVAIVEAVEAVEVTDAAPVAEAVAKPAAKKRGPGRPKKAAAAKKPAAKRGPGRPKKATAAKKAVAPVAEVAEAAEVAAETPAVAPAPKKKAGRPKKATATAKKPASGASKGPGRPRTKPAGPVSPLLAIKGVGPAMAVQFEAAGVKTPAAMAKLSNVKMADILAKCGPRYRNADATKMQAYRDAAAAAK